MVDLDEFPVALSESEALEPMMQIPPELPVLPLRDIVIYPFMIVALFVSRDRSIRSVDTVAGRGEYVRAGVTPISEPLAPDNSLEVEALVRNVLFRMERAACLG